jgi:hypothetical protein
VGTSPLAVVRLQVTFERNSAQASGGAVYLVAQQGTVTLEGDNTFKANSADGFGGGISTILSSVVVTGRLCGTSNTAGSQGGFVFADFGSSLVFVEGSEVNFGLNEPDAVTLTGGGRAQCGTGSTTWGNASSGLGELRFNITGPACACNDQFVNSAAAFQTCDSCGVGWDPDKCGCLVS